MPPSLKKVSVQIGRRGNPIGRHHANAAVHSVPRISARMKYNFLCYVSVIFDPKPRRLFV